MKTRHLALLMVLLGCQALTSCIKDEAKNTECDIESVWIEGEEYAAHFFQDTQMRIDNVPSSETQLTFTVRSLRSLPNLPLYFKVTPGATVVPASGSVQNFASGPVTYTVTSEDGAWQRQYTVAFKESVLPAFKFSFEHFEAFQGNNKNSYHVFYEVDDAGDRQNIWASGNAGVALVNSGKGPETYPTRSVADGYRGCGVCLSTQYAGDLGKMMDKPIAAGNLFLGRFIYENVLLEPLKTTEFGIPFDKDPVKVSGYYKYKPGEKFTDKKMKEVPGRTDEGNIYAVLYRNVDANGKEVKLYGDNVLSSPAIVKKAEIGTLPPADQWTPFEIYFEGDTPDPQVLAAMGYSLTLVFSSSKSGDTFEGAIGSTLYVDEVEITFNN